MDKSLISSLDQETQEFVKHLVSSGKYPSQQAVVVDALEVLKKQQAKQQKREHLRKLLMVGIRQAEKGEAIPYSRKLMNKAVQDAKLMLQNGDPVPDEIKP